MFNSLTTFKLMKLLQKSLMSYAIHPIKLNVSATNKVFYQRSYVRILSDLWHAIKKKKQDKILCLGVIYFLLEVFIFL